MARPRRTLAGLAAALGLGAVIGACLGSFGTWAWLRSMAPAAPAPVVAEALTLAPASFASLPGWGADDQAAALPALLASCARIRVARPEASLAPAGTAADWQELCTAAASLAPAAATPDSATVRQFLEEHLTPLAVGSTLGGEGLFTGYYEPSLAGSRTPDAAHRVPLLARPDDLVMVDLGRFRDSLKGERIAGRVAEGALEPYPDRAAIEAGALSDRARPLAFVADPVEAFFLHIQGSGLVTLADGGALRVGYAAQNGQPYVAIGRELIRRGALTRESVSMDSIKAWLAANPDEAAALLNSNPSYVFFRDLGSPPADPNGPLGGPPGAQNVPLTPGRSLAVDRKFLALGLPLWLDTTVPLADGGTEPLRRLMVAQDTGGAIRGPVRGDVFWGHGAEAGRRAGAMKQPGRYWILVPKAVAARLAKGEAGS